MLPSLWLLSKTFYYLRTHRLQTIVHRISYFDFGVRLHFPTDRGALRQKLVRELRKSKGIFT